MYPEKVAGLVITAQGYTRVPWDSYPKEVIMNTSKKS
jgi:hypothetical protein